MSERPAGRPVGGIDLALTALLVALTIFSVLVIVPSVQPALISDRLDLAITTAAALIGLSVAGLAWVNYRESRELRPLLQASAFGLLGAFNAATMLVSIANAEGAVGGLLADPGQLPILAGLTARLLMAALLVVAGLVGARRAEIGFPTARLALIGPSVAVLGATGLVAWLALPLPPIVSAEALAMMADDPTRPLGLGAGPVLIILQMFAAIGYLAAAWLSLRDWRRGHALADAWLAAAFSIAAFSQVHAGVHPGAYASLVTSADFLRVGFYLACCSPWPPSDAPTSGPCAGRTSSSSAFARPMRPAPRSRSVPAWRERSTTAWRRTCGTPSSSRRASSRRRRSARSRRCSPAR